MHQLLIASFVLLNSAEDFEAWGRVGLNAAVVVNYDRGVAVAVVCGLA